MRLRIEHDDAVGVGPFVDTDPELELRAEGFRRLQAAMQHHRQPHAFAAPASQAFGT
jgi:hypothetical protein